MRSLRNIPLRLEYRSDESDIVREFYAPCLSASVSYWRAVGYFTSQGLSLAAKGLADFIDSGGRMRLVASPYLSPEDVDAIVRGYEERAAVVERALLRELDLNQLALDDLALNRLECLAWLIAHDRLEIKLAIPRDSRDLGGIYHEKQGIFIDSEGNVVAFSGSSNETVGGLLSNFEAIDVFWSWDDPQGRVALKVMNFDRLWTNVTNRLEVVPFPDAVKKRLVTLARSSPPNQGESRETFQAPVRLRDYQSMAIEAWFAAKHHGILAMATGSGKTITAISALLRLFRRTGRLFVVIACPYQHLVEQWATECERFGIRPVLAYRSRQTWEATLASQITQFNFEARDLVVTIVTHSSLATAAFQDLLAQARGPSMLVADEVHHLGTTVALQTLPPNFAYRLGLSATPDRWMDEVGTAGIHGYFGNTVYEYSLRDAIRDGRLTPYYYYPHVVELTEAELDDYSQLTTRIARLSALASRDSGARQHLEALLRQRSNLLNKAVGKLAALERLVSLEPELKYALFYCAPGQLDAVTDLLGVKLGLTVHPFTAAEDSRTRGSLLKSFAAGKLQGLVAMRCLDEGVDVPVTQTAYILASSSNPREFIQRRGRILRRASGKSSATIHDLIAVPPQGAMTSDRYRVERAIVRRELMRFKEFASVAENRIEAEDVLFHIAQRYHLLDLWTWGDAR